MTTIYICGRDYKDDDGKIHKWRKVLYKSLKKSKLVEGDHYILGQSTTPDAELYWITSRITLRVFKKAIGAKKVLHHRYKFYQELKIVNDKIDLSFTKKEVELMNKYKKLFKPV